MSLLTKLFPQTLAGRVFALFAGTLLAFFSAGLALFYYNQFTAGIDDAQDSGQILSEVVMQTVTDSVVIGDYDTVKRMLTKAIQRSPFASISFIDRTGGIIGADQRAAPSYTAPAWLRNRVQARLFDINLVVAVGGRDYGVLRLRYAPEQIAGPIWEVTLSALAIGATLLLIGLLLISFSLNRWLGGLGAMRDFDWRGVGRTDDADGALRNAPIEIREAFDAFRRTGVELQAQRVTAAVTLDAVGDGVVTTDAHGRILYVNPAATTMLGGASGTLLRQPIASVFPVAFPGEASADALAPWSGRRVEIAAGLRHRAIYDTSFTVIHGADAERIGFVLVLRDVTAAQAYEDQLRSELATRRAAVRALREVLFGMLPADALGQFAVSDTDLEGVSRLIGNLVKEREASRGALDNQKFALDQHAAVSVSDADGTITYANAKFSELSGYAIEELIGSNHRVTASGVHTKEFYDEIWETITHGRVWHGEIVNRRQSGDLYWTTTTIVPWLDEHGLPRQYIAIRTDISQQKRVEHALEEARRRELATGVEIQRALLFGDRPSDVPAAEIASYTEPSLGIDGDFYAFTRYDADCLELLVGDVMGKGVPAALVGAAVRTAYTQVGTELLAGSLGSSALPQPAAIVNALHRKITRRLIELDTFVTLALYRFDFRAGTMTFVNAGHTEGVVLRRGGETQTLLGENLPLGVLGDEQYVAATVDVAPGDALVVFSDGVTEARGADGEEFGSARLTALLEEAARAGLPAAICMQRLRHTVRDFVGVRAIPDDQTAVMVTVRPPVADGTVAEFELPWHMNGLALLRQQVGSAAAPLGELAADRLVLATFEAATNVVRHVRRPFDEATICCRIACAAGRVAVELWYLGRAFQPPAEPNPDFSGQSEGGFGLYIIAQSVSEVRYDAPLPGVCCTRLLQLADELPGG